MAMFNFVYEYLRVRTNLILKQRGKVTDEDMAWIKKHLKSKGHPYCVFVGALDTKTKRFYIGYAACPKEVYTVFDKSAYGEVAGRRIDKLITRIQAIEIEVTDPVERAKRIAEVQFKYLTKVPDSIRTEFGKFHERCILYYTKNTPENTTGMGPLSWNECHGDLKCIVGDAE